MKHVKLFENFVEFQNLSIELKNHVQVSELNEASKSDFKPSLTMVKYAIGDHGSTNANDAVKFATSVMQQWQDLDNDSKEKALDKWNTIKGNFKKSKQKLSDAAGGGDGKTKAIMREITASTPKAKDVFSKSIEPLLKDDSGESSKKDEEKVKAEIEKLKPELEKAEAEFKEARKKFDDGEIKWNEVQPLVAKKMELEAKMINLEGQIDDEDAEEVKDLKSLQAEFKAAEAEFKAARKKYDDGEIKWNEVQPLVTKMMDIESEISGLVG